jgi:Dioxygenase
MPTPKSAIPPLLVLLVPIAACGGDSGRDSAPADRPAAASDRPAAASDQARTGAGGFPRTPKCRPGREATAEQTEGPYYKAGAPRRRSLLDSGVSGTRLVIRGRVLSTACRPLRGARLDFWQADGKGEYDNTGYRLRGYQLTGPGGGYRLETVAPARYEARTRHIHVKVTRRGGETLTTQLYFPGEAGNRTDPIAAGGPLLRLRRGASLWRGSFDFVVE